MSRKFSRYQPVKVPRLRYTVGIPKDLHAQIERAATADKMTMSDWLLDAAMQKLHVLTPTEAQEISKSVAAYSVGRMLDRTRPYLKGIEGLDAKTQDAGIKAFKARFLKGLG